MNLKSLGITTGAERPRPSRRLEHQPGQASERFVDDAFEQINRTAFENLLCVEVVSGSGRLTATIRKMGVRAVAMDRSTSRTSGPATTLDLTKPDDLEFLKNHGSSMWDVFCGKKQKA